MKPNRFLWIFLLLLAGSAGTYFLSCQREAETTDTTKPLSNTPVGSRAHCDDPNYCNVAITADADVNLSLCGDIIGVLTTCSTGCNSSTDVGMTGFFPEDETREFCMGLNARLCISTSPTSVTVNVTIQFGTSTPITRTILPGQTLCFHSDNCTVTDDDCN